MSLESIVPDRQAQFLDPATRSFVEHLLMQQRDLTLATVRPDGYPQANTVSYASEGLALYFATGRYSQKVRNLERSSKASVTVDAPYTEWAHLRGVSMGGHAMVLEADDAQSNHAFDLLAQKFPGLARLPRPGQAAAIAFVRFVPEVISVLDYSQGFGHTELVDVRPSDLAT
jgi:nitroimidazol reductase NimA-like FMN-containing flavoprotein (pyridoxamine 5'-phosphate oxidase superfamily)